MILVSGLVDGDESDLPAPFRDCDFAFLISVVGFQI